MSLPNRYTCEQMFRVLDDYLDRELSPEEMLRVEEHLATCAQCASEYGFEGALLDGLKEKIRRIEVPQSAVDRVTEALKTAARKNRTGRDSTEPRD